MNDERPEYQDEQDGDEDGMDLMRRKAFEATQHWRQMITDAHGAVLKCPKEFLLDDMIYNMQFAMSLGMAICFDKKIVLVVEPGSKTPDALVSLASRVIEADCDEPYESVEPRITETLEDMLKEEKEAEKEKAKKGGE